MIAGRTYGLTVVALCAAISLFMLGCGSGGTSSDSAGTATVAPDKAEKPSAATKEKSPAEADGPEVEDPEPEAPEPGGEAGSLATRIEGRLKAAGYPVEVKAKAPNTVGAFNVSFEGGPTANGYSITAYVYDTAADAASELKAFEAAFSSASPEAIGVQVVDTRLYLAAAGPGGAVPPGALGKFVKVAEGE